MSSTENSFSVVICHGSYHTPEPYQPFIKALNAEGIETFCPQLPSSDLTKLNVGDPSNPDFDKEPPPNGFPQPADDAVVLGGLLNRLIVVEGKEVILLGHSSGGFVATLVSQPELQAEVRKREGARGGIVGIFYVSGFLIPVGESVNSFYQPKDGSEPVVPPYMTVHKYGFKGVGSTKDGAKYFFNDLDEATAKFYEARLTASPIFTTILSNNAYSSLPLAYLVTENDMALPAPYQDGMIALLKQGPEVDITVYRCPSGHSPHLSWTKGLVGKVKEFRQKVVGQMVG